jgi:hypothetical protein
MRKIKDGASSEDAIALNIANLFKKKKITVLNM